MTMSRGASRILYLGNGQATEFSFPFRVWDENQLSVRITGPDGKSRAGSGWSARLDENGGIIRYLHEGAPLPDGWKLVIMRNMPFVQEVDLITGTRFDPEVLETALDVATAERQQLLETLERAIVVEPTSGESPQDLLADIFSSRATAVNSAASAAASARTASTAAAEATGSADAARASELAAAASAASAADVVPLATPVLPGKVMPQTGDNDGLMLGSDGSLKARIATLTQPGVVRPDGTTITAGDTGVITANGPLLQCNRRLIITESGSWTSPVTGWARITCIGGGGGGGGVPKAGVRASFGGQAGGDTSFASLLARGGSGGAGGWTGWGLAGAGGGSGEVVGDYFRLSKGVSYPVIVGAGGNCVYGAAATGIKHGSNFIDEHPTETVETFTNTGGGFWKPGEAGRLGDAVYSNNRYWKRGQNGGDGGDNGTDYGGGGGGAGSTAAMPTDGIEAYAGGYGGRGGSSNAGDGQTAGNLDIADTQVAGGNGGDGAIIIEFCDPEYEPDTEPDIPDNDPDNSEEAV